MAGPHLVDLHGWLGGAEPLDPASMQYRARLAPDDAGPCSGCVFRGQRSKVCKEAGALAVRAGMPDCDDIDAATGRTFVYALVPLDLRQLDLTKEADDAAATP